MIRFLPPLAAALTALLLLAAPSAHAQTFGPTNPTAPLCTAERFHQGFNHLVSANWTAYDRDTDPFRVLGRGLANQYIEFASWNNPSVHPPTMATNPSVRDGSVEVYATTADRVRMQNIWNSMDYVYAYGRGPMLVLVQKRSYFPEQAPIFESILGEACP